MYNRKLLSKEITRGVRYLYLGLAVVIIAVVGLYLTLLSDSSYHGYLFSQHQLTEQELLEEKDQLKQELLDFTSQAYLEEVEAADRYIEAPRPVVVDSRQERLTKR